MLSKDEFDKLAQKGRKSRAKPKPKLARMGNSRRSGIQPHIYGDNTRNPHTPTSDEPWLTQSVRAHGYFGTEVDAMKCWCGLPEGAMMHAGVK